MRRWLVLLLGIVGCHAQAQMAAPWFTVHGNPLDATVDTVQVDPVAIRTDGHLKTMNVRVSRAVQRFNWEKLPYRSYEARVVFNCRTRRAGYMFATFYSQPLWQGPPSASTDYAASPQPMLFLDIEPNPTQRIIRAACQAPG
ncbi:MAG: hypothetical protein J7549_18995 [Variovorax sp.]|nr:hypothetical protein [Variovorax sp.]